MSSSDHEAPFFIGWSRSVPAPLLRFCAVVGLVLMLGLSGLGLLLGRSVEDPAERLLAFMPAVASRPDAWRSDQALAGVVTSDPYAILHIPPDGPFLAGRSVLLAGDGKRGPALGDASAGNSPSAVALTGGLLMRGDVPMLVVDGATRAEGVPMPAPLAQSLGRWRIAGEICDGKCYTGGMRPGTGLAHRACANLCLVGEVPALFVAAQPVAGHGVLVLAGPDGRAPAAIVRTLTATPLELEGDVDKLGDVLIFRTDLSKAHAP